VSSQPQRVISGGLPAEAPFEFALEPRLIALITAGLVAIPPLVDVIVHGFRKVFFYMAADCFYYFTVAANFPSSHMFTFDQLHPTNGFHPLWQLLLALEYTALSPFPDPRKLLMVAAFLTGAVLLAAGVYLVALEAARPLRGASILLPGLTVGAFGAIEIVRGLCGGDYHPRYVTTWNSINGMESALSVLAFGGLMHFLLRDGSPENRPWLGVGLMMALVILSRLDNIFVLPSFLCVVACEANFLQGRRRAALLRGAALATLVAAGLVGSYLIYSRVAVGSFLPLSGKIKSSFPHVTAENFVNAWHWITGADDPVAQRSTIHWRLTQEFIPLVLILVNGAWAVFATLFRENLSECLRSPWNRFLILGSLWMIALHLYNVLFVHIYHQGHWYFPLSFLFVSLLAFHRLRPLLGLAPALTRARAPAMIIITILSLAQLTHFALYFFAPRILLGDRIFLGEENRYHYYEIFQDRAVLAHHYAGQGARFIDFTDGVFGYTLPYPTLAGIGLCIDKEGYRAILEGRFHELALERGFDRIAWIYKDGLTAQSTSEEVTAHFMSAPFAPRSPDYAFHIDFFPPWTPMYFIARFERLHG
jgi:hypothetical protein